MRLVILCGPPIENLGNRPHRRRDTLRGDRPLRPLPIVIPERPIPRIAHPVAPPGI